jgi:hypothetical protein
MWFPDRFRNLLSIYFKSIGSIGFKFKSPKALDGCDTGMPPALVNMLAVRVQHGH